MTLHVQLIDLQVYERLTPLASGLMAAAVLEDPQRAGGCDVALKTWSVQHDAAGIASDVLADPCDLVGFSTYVWNARLVRRVAALLSRSRPELPILIGGPQVVHRAAAWRDLAPNLLIANGEGEPIFVDVVERLLGGTDPWQAAGVSGFREGAYVEQTAEAELADLDRVPSPFLMGLFPSGRYTQAILETNRGCPFECTFCFWGLGEKRVRKFPDDRVREELDWIRRESMLSVFVADANFGMYPRDEEIAISLAASRRELGTPIMVAFNSMKNRPERMVRIAEIVGDAGLATTQSMAIQSMDERTLVKAGRKTIRTSAYSAALQELNTKGLTTYVELIWPLPGETLESFEEGIDELCAMGAQCLVIYPLLALPNTGIHERREEYGLQLTGSGEQESGEYLYVTATQEVSEDACREGLWLVLAVNLLYDTRVLSGVMSALRRRGIRHVEVLRSFGRWLRGHCDLSLVERHRKATAGIGHAAWSYWGAVAFDALHSERSRFEAAVESFCVEQPWWDESLRAALEVDRLLLPCLFANTPLRSWEGVELRATLEGRRRLRVQFTERARAELQWRFPHAALGGMELDLDHGRDQLPHFRSQAPGTAYDYAYGQLQRIQHLVPRVESVSETCAS